MWVIVSRAGVREYGGAPPLFPRAASLVPGGFARRANVSNLCGRGILDGDLSSTDIGALAFVPPENDDAGDVNR